MQRNRELTGIEVLNYDARAAVASVAVGVMSNRSNKPLQHLWRLAPYRTLSVKNG